MSKEKATRQICWNFFSLFLLAILIFLKMYCHIAIKEISHKKTTQNLCRGSAERYWAFIVKCIQEGCVGEWVKIPFGGGKKRGRKIEKEYRRLLRNPLYLAKSYCSHRLVVLCYFPKVDFWRSNHVSLFVSSSGFCFRGKKF